MYVSKKQLASHSMRFVFYITLRSSESQSRAYRQRVRVFHVRSPVNSDKTFDTEWNDIRVSQLLSRRFSLASLNIISVSKSLEIRERYCILHLPTSTLRSMSFTLRE